MWMWEYTERFVNLTYQYNMCKPRPTYETDTYRKYQHKKKEKDVSKRDKEKLEIRYE